MLLIRDWFRQSIGSKAENYSMIDNSGMMLKLFNSGYPYGEIEREMQKAQAVERAGVKTPHAYKIDQCDLDDRFGIVYERIINKKSVSKLCTDNPDDIATYAKLFANEAKKLHSAECDTEFFHSRKKQMVEFFENSRIPAGKKKVILKALRETADVTTCLHGDFQTGSLVVSKRFDSLIPYWIDIGRFSWGDPMFDIGWFRFYVVFGHYGFIGNKLHMTPSQLQNFWNEFVKEYCGIETDEEIMAFNRRANIFMAVMIADIEQRNYTGYKKLVQKWMEWQILSKIPSRIEEV